MTKYQPSLDENTFDITLTEGELRTIAVAINGYVREATKDEIKDARRSIDRAFALQEKLRKLYAEK